MPSMYTARTVGGGKGGGRSTGKFKLNFDVTDLNELNIATNLVAKAVLVWAHPTGCSWDKHHY
jgi:hypothetical protein